jgi:capsular exopolysaccharide synthesis family protein
VTSAARGEGKTLVVAGLAYALTLVGARVTAVDCDLRQPALDARLGVEGSRGLSEALVTPSSATGLLQPTELPNLQVLPAGGPSPNAAVLLTRESFSRVLDELRGSADYVICDMPPVTLGADAAVASASVDAVIVVVDSGSARRSGLVAVREQLENSGTRVLGVVLNGVKRDRRSYVRVSHGPGDPVDGAATDRAAERLPVARATD